MEYVFSQWRCENIPRMRCCLCWWHSKKPGRSCESESLVGSAVFSSLGAWFEMVMVWFSAVIKTAATVKSVSVVLHERYCQIWWLQWWKKKTSQFSHLKADAKTSCGNRWRLYLSGSFLPGGSFSPSWSQKWRMHWGGQLVIDIQGCASFCVQSEVKSDSAVCNCSRVNWPALAVSSTTQLLLEASFFSQLFYFCLRNNVRRVCVVHSSSSWALLTLTLTD